MQLKLSGNRPTAVDPVHTIRISGDYDPVSALKKSLVDPLFKAARKTSKVSCTDPKGNAYGKKEMRDVVLRAVGEVLDQDAEEAAKSFFAQGLINYDPQNPMVVNEVFAAQAGHAHRFPNHRPGVIYKASHDVIPAAKRLLGGGDGSEFFAALAYTYSPEALGFWFKTEDDWNDFTEWVKQEAASLSGVLPGKTMTLVSQFAQKSLKMVEGYVIRKDDTDQNEEYSFARVIVYLTMQYLKQNAKGWGKDPAAGAMPFLVSELFSPRTIVFACVEAHAQATPKKVENEWNLIVASLASPVKVVSNKQLASLTALPRAQAKAAAQAANTQSNKQKAHGRAARIKFRKQPPTSVDIKTGLLRALKRMKEVARSQNAIKRVTTSFAKANRRDPRDYNKPGKIVSTRYLPDIHVYVDTSGSISERNYQQAMLMLIRLAKDLDVNLYFSSFSHVMSQEVCLRTKGKTVNQIWQEFRRIPKVDGGTDYAQIWRYIEMSPTRQRRLSLVITDFEWEPRNIRQTHPKNLYYAPCGNMDWDRMVYYARNYTRSMRHIEPALAQRLIGITA